MKWLQLTGTLFVVAGLALVAFVQLRRPLVAKSLLALLKGLDANQFSLLLNLALFSLTIVSIAIALESYRSADEGGALQLKALATANSALEASSHLLTSQLETMNATKVAQEQAAKTLADQLATLQESRRAFSQQLETLNRSDTALKRTTSLLQDQLEVQHQTRDAFTKTSDVLVQSAAFFAQHAKALQDQQLLARQEAAVLQDTAKYFATNAEALRSHVELMKQYEDRRDTAIVEALSRDTTTNLILTRKNVLEVSQELQLLKQGKRLVGPLSLIQGGAWRLLFGGSVPPALQQVPGLVDLVVSSGLAIDLVNATIASRESFRVSNQALSGMSQQLEIYDQSLLLELNGLKGYLEALEAALAQTAAPVQPAPAKP